MGNCEASKEVNAEKFDLHRAALSPPISGVRNQCRTLIELIFGDALDFDFTGFAKDRDTGDNGRIAEAIILESRGLLDFFTFVFDAEGGGNRSATLSGQVAAENVWLKYDGVVTAAELANFG